MKVLVTGASGYIGSVLVGVLRERGSVAGQRIEALALADQHLAAGQPAGTQTIIGDLGSDAVLGQIAAFAPDVTIHLAAMPGGASEADYAAGKRVNLDATLGLFETLGSATLAHSRPPVVVYASTVAVYGTALPAIVDAATPLRPAITYGAHKLACEIMLADFSRRKLLDGRSARLPGIVARPRAPSGLTSAFMSDILHALAAGERFTCPVSAHATAWWMSARRCAENLLHAAGIDISSADAGRAWPLPVLRLSMEQVVRTLARLYGADREGLVHYDPQPGVEAVFGRYPVLDDSASRALGLRDDGTAEDMVRRAMGLQND